MRWLCGIDDSAPGRYAAHVAAHLARRLGGEFVVEVVDLRSLRPLDVGQWPGSVAKTSRVVCVEEGWPT
jgi:pyruvate dehydrogenase E1 component beta subunit